ncbi:MAG: hypothetical protein ABEJ42_04035 [Halobacteriaceae archaeon]
MGLADIAASVGTTTDAQEARGVAAVDATDRPLVDRLDEFAADLPCEPAAAATVAETYAGGASVGESARDAGVAAVTAAKTLHRLGFEGLSPLGPTGREVVRDWLAAALPRTEALTLTGATEAEFALAAYVETHDPVPGARAAVDGAIDPGVAEDGLADALDGVGQ